MLRKAITPATEIFMKQRTPEPDPDEINIPSRQATDTTLVSQNAVSYDYADEEAAYQSLEKKTNSAAHKRNRMSTDNKAYRPYGVGTWRLHLRKMTMTTRGKGGGRKSKKKGEGKGRRRKSKKKDVGGSLLNFPVVQYDKKKRRKARGDKGNGSVEEERSVSDEHVEQVSIQVYQSNNFNLLSSDIPSVHYSFTTSGICSPCVCSSFKTWVCARLQVQIRWTHQDSPTTLILVPVFPQSPKTKKGRSRACITSKPRQLDEE